MNPESNEMHYDLLIKKAVYGLDETEQTQLDELDTGKADQELHSLEITAAAIGMAGLTTIEAMPAHLRSMILEAAPKHLASEQTQEAAEPVSSGDRILSAYDDTTSMPRFSWFSLLGWAAAAAACVALAINIWITRNQPTPEIARVQTPAETPRPLSPAEMRAQMMSSGIAMINATWGPGNMKDVKQVSGDIVWSSEKQMGYMKLQGLPKNDPSRETYQLWIVDKTRDQKFPIDGGTFDVTSDGEIIIPIDAKLKAVSPEMFAITMEKPGGVVVSKQEKVAAVAKVETKPAPAA
jgi:anti-sigma-K factor RskA